ncbi:hypothetical protein DM02DRAFT_605389 [Periconia macrospinosa]|uniref:DUF2510 domain-containing protein n=1 Tax=Periconia macrospinosa TaxID=97972 RepID=A0A2V1D2Z8_9PLEO|nr:hypothetical protein DM02DRAFT_605389 [Periconia macrospinosa]
MSYNQIIKKKMLGAINKGGKQIVLSAATETSHWTRPEVAAEAIKPTFEQAVQEYTGPLPNDTTEICARENDHTSKADSRDHISGVCFDSKGGGTTVHFPVKKTHQSYHTSQQASVQQSSSASPQWVWDANAKRYRYWNGREWIWQ